MQAAESDFLPMAGRVLRALPSIGVGVPILTYHRIAHDAFSFVTPENFAAQMKFLRESFAPVPLGEVVDCLESGRSLPPRTVVVTFDDGYRDNYQYAFPVLEALGIPATFFITTGIVGGDGAFWWDRLAENLKNVDAVVEAWPPLASRLLGLRRDEAIRVVTEYAKVLEHAEARAMIDAVCEPPEQRPRVAMSWPELREMAEAGMDIGSHTVTHPILARQSFEEAAREIIESKATLEANLGRPVHHFAYPNGRKCDVSEEVLHLVEKAGYRSACSTINGAVKRGSSRFMLERIPARNTPIRFLLKVMGIR